MHCPILSKLVRTNVRTSACTYVRTSHARTRTSVHTHRVRTSFARASQQISKQASKQAKANVHKDKEDVGRRPGLFVGSPSAGGVLLQALLPLLLGEPIRRANSRHADRLSCVTVPQMRVVGGRASPPPICAPREPRKRAQHAPVSTWSPQLQSSKNRPARAGAWRWCRRQRSRRAAKGCSSRSPLIEGRTVAALDARRLL